MNASYAWRRDARGTTLTMTDDLLLKHQRLEELAAEIAGHEHAYRQGVPVISDQAFDELVDERERLEEELGIGETERGQARPGSDHTEGFAQVAHRSPMLSLQKLSPSRTDTEGQRVSMHHQLRQWYTSRCKDLELEGANPLRLIVEPKIDGISVSLWYRNGKLTRALTRGDGRRGDDITRQVLMAQAAPLRLQGVSGSVEIRGELYWPLDAFQAFNERRVAGAANDSTSPSDVGTLFDDAIESLPRSENLKHLEDPEDLKKKEEIKGLPLFTRPCVRAMPRKKSAKKKSLEPLSNPRNGCAGLMKTKLAQELEELRHSGIRTFAYQVPWSEGVDVPRTQHELLAWLEAVGASVYSEHVFVTPQVDEAVAFCAEFEGKRSSLGFDIDGMVIKIDELDLYDRLGSTDHHPHWAVAYKFAPERKATTLRGVVVQVGKSGRLTPVAILDSVRLAGTNVTRASLHSFSELESKDIRIGDTVYVEKAGEIIPQVVGVDLGRRSAEVLIIERPHECPSCGSGVVREDAFDYCPNPSCPAQLRERLRHFASRRAMDIEGVGPALIDRLVDTCGIASPEELFSLTQQQLQQANDTEQTTLAAKTVRAIARAKDRGLERVLVGLSIRHVGPGLAQVLASYFRTADALIDFAKRYCSGDEQVCQLVVPKAGAAGVIAGMGKTTADSVFAELASDSVVRVFEGLRRAGVKLTAEDGSAGVALVAGVHGKTFVLTGKLPTLTRTRAAELITGAGGKVASSVTRAVDYVVVGEDAGSKRERAQKLGIAELDEDALVAMVSQKR